MPTSILVRDNPQPLNSVFDGCRPDHFHPALNNSSDRFFLRHDGFGKTERQFDRLDRSVTSGMQVRTKSTRSAAT